MPFNKGWSTLNGWAGIAQSSTSPQLYALQDGVAGGGVNVDGQFVVTESGYYTCAAQVRLDFPSKSATFRIVIALNGTKDANAGVICFAIWHGLTSCA